ILDTVRAASLSLYGYAQPTTPKLARWAARGVVFEQAMAPAPWTLPSHGTLFTGRWPHELSAGWLTPLDGRWPTLAERFAARGYRTAGFVANLQYATYEHGLARGFQRYEDYPLSLSQVLLSSALGRTLINAKTPRRLIGTDEHLNRKSAAELRGDFLHWMGDGAEGRPYFAFLNFYDAHEPYLPPDEYFRRFAGHDRANHLSPLRRYALGQRRAKATAADIALERAAYDGSIAYLDDQLDALFSELERRGVMANTLVVITSDHGEEFAEHGVFYHGHTLYMPALHVPLIMWMKGRVPAGERIARPVSLRDVAATVLDLAGRRGEAGAAGTSLAVLWGAHGDSAGAPVSPVVSEVQRGIRLPDWYPAAHDDLRSIVADDRHFIDGPKGKGALYDFRADPWEQRDLSTTPAGRAEVARLRERLAPFVRAPGTAPAGVPMAGPE
ncbi:MAG TPA: sulfatase, partial [Gemmatimonadaceae bacterium]|nr:sulfatase [Gemmatimonadaceae bacterium]